MDVQTLTEAFRRGCFAVALSGLGAASLAACGVWLFRQARRLHASCQGQPVLRRLALMALLVLAFTVGGTKTNGVNNLPPQQMALPQLQPVAFPQPAAPRLQGSLPVTNLAPIATWSRTGAYSNEYVIEFPENWCFPHGTNHLASVALVARGEVFPSGQAEDPLVALATPLSVKPDDSEVVHGPTTNNSYRIEWHACSRSRTVFDPTDAAIEFCRNGDVEVTENGVTTRTPRTLPFAHDGYGQDAEWVTANFTNATEILAVGYPQWVDAQVGTDLTNGLYKLTVTVSEDPPETTQITVGDLSVAVTNAGEYVFLLGKGIRYPFSASADCATNFIYTAEDDVPQTRLLGGGPVLRTGPDDDGRWIVDDDWVFLPPHYRYCLYEPSLEVMPNRWEPSVFSPEKTFTAVLHDMPWFAPSPIYQWTSCGGADVAIASPDQPTTAMTCPFPASHGSDVDLRLTALVGAVPLQADFHCSTESYNVGDYDILTPVNGETPALVMESYPSVVFFEKGQPNFETSDVACRYRVASAGTFTLTLSGDACSVVDMENNTASSGYTWRVEGACSGVRHFTAASTMKSSSPDGTAFAVTFTPDDAATALSGAAGVVFVEWETETRATWPSDTRRRTIGVCEEVAITLDPVPAGLALLNRMSSSELHNQGNGRWAYIAADSAATDEVFVPFVKTLFSFEILAPTGYDAKLARIEKDPTEGVSGAFKMCFDLVLLPTNVSFSAIQVKEVGMTSANAVGYFAEPRNACFLSHTPAVGSDVWCGIGDKNSCVDEAQMAELPPPWHEGSMAWPIPNMYRSRRNPQAERYFCNTDQLFWIDAGGTATEAKFGWFAAASTNRVFNYGRTIMP